MAARWVELRAWSRAARLVELSAECWAPSWVGNWVVRKAESMVAHSGNVMAAQRAAQKAELWEQQ